MYVHVNNDNYNSILNLNIRSNGLEVKLKYKIFDTSQTLSKLAPVYSFSKPSSTGLVVLNKNYIEIWENCD